MFHLHIQYMTIQSIFHLKKHYIWKAKQLTWMTYDCSVIYVTAEWIWEMPAIIQFRTFLSSYLLSESIKVKILTYKTMRWESTVSNITRLHDEKSEVWIPAQEKDISVLQNVQAGSGTHAASCSMGTRQFSLGRKWLGNDNHSPTIRTKVKNEWNYIFSPHLPPCHIQGWC